MAEQMVRSASATTLADILDRVLDKGVVIVGDVKVNLAQVELLTIKIRLLIASVDTAKKLGIDWWERDRSLSSKAEEFEERLGQLEARVAGQG